MHINVIVLYTIFVFEFFLKIPYITLFTDNVMIVKISKIKSYDIQKEKNHRFEMFLLNQTRMVT